ncbi:MAG: glycine--tRNA ligase subunit beta [Alphaproteobacteria bacterium]
MAEFLFELFSEEIPARMQARAADDLKRLVTDGLKAAGLAFDKAEAFATPRRLALVVDGLPEKQPDLREERRGPRADAPEKAIQGFLASAGLSSVDQCAKREIDKGTFLFAVVEKKGQSTAVVLPGLIHQSLAALPWPKSMRWGHAGFRWVRPLHSVLAVFAGRRLDGAIDLQGAQLPFVDTTCGHRFLAPEPFAVAGFADYERKLEAAKVLLDPAERRSRIEAGLEAAAKAQGLTVKRDPGLLDEVTGLVEWPVVRLGRIDPAFMELPPEVLTSSMRAHQKYFSLENSDGSLSPHFGVVANMETEDNGKRIVAGNERVLRARLSDAKFFWDQDRKHTLASRAPALKEIVFHAKLGTLDAKVDRVQALADSMADHVPGADKDRVRSAARLCKADLVTGMVGEFPDLQGIMGRYYALHDREHGDVADAIAEHYSPLGPNDRCPTAPVSVAVALADKIDTLAAFWLIDEKPTGSRDPFALRRAALGVIRLIVENGLRVPLSHVFSVARENMQGVPAAGSDDVISGLLDFFADRLKVHLRERGVRHDLISAVFALGGEDDLVRLLARVGALEKFLGSDDGANLLTAYKRAANIVRIEERKDKTAYDALPDSKLFKQDEEVVLYEALRKAAARAKTALKGEDFAAAMSAMASLRPPVDAFFDHVTVNTEDGALRANRLRLLSAIGNTLHQVADFSKIEG